jgi:hypothetical protein
LSHSPSPLHHSLNTRTDALLHMNDILICVPRGSNTMKERQNASIFICSSLGPSNVCHIVFSSKHSSKFPLPTKNFQQIVLQVSAISK